MPATSTATATRFNPRPLVRRDSGERPGNLHHQVSTHAPLAGSDGATWETSAASSSFNPRSPCGERRSPAGCSRHRAPVSTHAPLAGSYTVATQLDYGYWVSTHAPLAGSDAGYSDPNPPSQGFTHAPLAGSDAGPGGSAGEIASFNPRSPCGERPIGDPTYSPSFSFQPTLPLRGATGISISINSFPFCFNPRSPCGERRRWIGCTRYGSSFNPRSPCGERLRVPHRR